MAKIVGGSEKQRLRWIVERFWPLSQSGEPPTVTEIAAFLLLQGGAGSRLGVMPRVRQADLRLSADQLREGLSLIVEGEQWKISVSEQIDRLLVRRAGVRGIDEDEPYGARSTWQPRFSSGLLTAFLLTAADLIERQHHLLKKCRRQDCGRLFVRDDKRQNYCSPRCSQTGRTRRLRAKNIAAAKTFRG